MFGIIQPESALLFLNEHFNISLKSLICGNFSTIENSNPLPKDRIIRDIPHTKLSIDIIILLIDILSSPFKKSIIK